MSLGIVETGFKQSWSLGLENISIISLSQLRLSPDWHPFQAGGLHVGMQMTTVVLDFHWVSLMAVAERHWLQK